MALTIDNDGAALVAGAPFQQKTRTVRVVRAFMHGGKATKVDAVVSLPAAFAAEMVSAGKAEYAAAADKPAEKPAEKPGKKE